MICWFSLFSHSLASHIRNFFSFFADYQKNDFADAVNAAGNRESAAVGWRDNILLKKSKLRGSEGQRSGAKKFSSSMKSSRN